MPGPAGERRLAAILAADVVGYSRLMAADEDGTHARLRALRTALVEPAVQAHGGHIVKVMGDGALIEFPSIVGAVDCAVAMQRDLEARDGDLPEEERLRLRIGINLGDIIHDDDDIYGDGVNVAARLEALAAPGGILVSGSVHEHLRGKTALTFEAMGRHRVKNLPEPLAVYRIAGFGPAPPWRLRPPQGRRLAGAVALSLAVLAAVGGLWWLGRLPDFAGPADRPGIAIMPFDSLDPDEAYVADGLADDLVTDLARVSGLFVVGRNAIPDSARTAGNLGDTARDLGVRYVVGGDVRHTAGRLRINVQLIDVETGEHLWAERFERDAADILRVQDEVRQRIVEALAIRLSPAEALRLERLPTTNLEAYDYYLRAGHAAGTGYRPKLAEALQLYARAASLDPAFAEALAADARLSVDIMRNNYDDILPAPLARQRAYDRAGRALQIDPEASLPFAVLAVLQAVDERHDEAITSAERAVALAPGDAEAYAALGLVLTYSGRHAQAAAAIEQALKLNPRPPTGDAIVAGMAFFLDHRTDRAIAVLEQARDAAPNVDDVHAMLAAAYAVAGRMDEARRAVEAALRYGTNVCTELYRVVWAQFRETADVARILAAMTAAGMPQWPAGFDTDPLEHLKSAEIEPIVFGRLWRGQLEGGEAAIAQFEKDGRMAFRTAAIFATGRAFVDGDRLCEQMEATMLGRPACGPVLRRPAGSGEDGLDYTYVNGSKVFHFAVTD